MTANNALNHLISVREWRQRNGHTIKKDFRYVVSKRFRLTRLVKYAKFEDKHENDLGKLIRIDLY